jgi:hypothetical protein
LSFSIDGRFDMEAVESDRSSQFSELKRAGEAPRCQKARGDALPNGEESNGEESRPLPIICWSGLARRMMHWNVIVLYLCDLIVAWRVSALLHRTDFS